MSSNLYYRIATTQAGLEKGANFFVLGLPRADLVSFTDHAERLPQGAGGESRQGYASVTVLWLRLPADAAGVLRGLIEAAEVIGGSGNGTLFLTVPRTDAKAIGVSWVDLSGIAIMPNWATLEGAPGHGYENVELKLNNVTVLATPSTVQS